MADFMRMKRGKETTPGEFIAATNRTFNDLIDQLREARAEIKRLREKIKELESSS